MVKVYEIYQNKIEIIKNQQFIKTIKEENDKQIINYDTIALNKSIEANYFFKNEDFSAHSKKVNENYPKIMKNSANKSIHQKSDIKYSEEKQNEITQPISKVYIKN